MTLIKSARGMPVIEKNPFNDNEEHEAFDKMVSDICEETVRQRFNYSSLYSGIKPVAAHKFANKHRVYLAINNRSKHPVVFKLKHPSDAAASASDAALEFRMNMFEVHFCKMLCTKCHPNIVQLNSVWAVRQFHEVYIEFEQCETSLAQVLVKFRNRLPLPMARRYMAHMMEALRFCHANRIIHGDVKEENMLLSKGVLKLCDFDSSRETDKDGTIRYTDEITDRRYLPLEQLVGLDVVSTATDMYAAGCVFVKMLAGRKMAFEYDSLDRQVQINRMEMYGGPIPQWYFDHARLPLRPIPIVNSGDTSFVVFFQEIYHRDAQGIAIDLLRRLFEFDQAVRISALMAISHPFFYTATMGIGDGDARVEDIVDDDDSDNKVITQ